VHHGKRTQEEGEEFVKTIKHNSDGEAPLFLIHAPDDIASFLRYPFVRFLRRGDWKRCGGFD
jgi:hypothetical protein